MKKITLMKNLATAVIFALAISSTVSCDPEEKKVDEKTYMIELANPLDKDIMIDPEQTEDITVGLKLTNLTKEQLTIDQGNQEWCYASFSTDKDEIILVHGENSDAQDLVAEFTVSADVTGAEPLKFKVTKRGSEVDVTISITSDNPDFVKGEYSTNYNAGATENTLTITVHTNASMWYLSYMSMSDEEWFTADKTSGRNGETCTITFKENKSGNQRTQYFVFDIEPDSQYSDATFTAMQSAFPASSVTVKEYDSETETIGNSFDTNKAVALNNGRDKFEFYLVKDGGVDFKWAETGSNVFLEEDPDWIYYGNDDIYDDTWTAVDKYYSVMTSPNATGAARNIDLVILPAGGTTELFRFKITQAAE